MKKLIKKSILNGIIRTVVSIFYTIFLKLKSKSSKIDIKESKRFHVKKENFIEINNDCKISCLTYSNKSKIPKNFNQINFISNQHLSKKNFESKEEFHVKYSNTYCKKKVKNEYVFDENNVQTSSFNHSYYNCSNYEDKFSAIKLHPQHKDTSQITTNENRFFRIRSIIVFVFIIVGYVSLNNYFIMFVYFQSTANQKLFDVQSTTTSFTPTTTKSHQIIKKIESNDLSFFQFRSFISLFSDDNDDNKKALLQEENLQFKNTNIDINLVELNTFKIFIDPIDLEVAGLNSSRILAGNGHRVLLEETYFDEDDELVDINSGENSNSKNLNSGINSYRKFNLLKVENYELLDVVKRNNSSFEKKKKIRRPCVHPNLNPYDKEIMKFVKKETELKCNPKINWIFVENGTLRVSKSAIKKHGTIVCAYIPLYRGNNDFSVYEGNRIFPVIDKMPLITDFFKIDCRSKDGAIYSNIHSGIAYESSLHMRHIWNPMPKKALGYNVLMFGFDSVSRMSWIRMLPKTYEYMIKEGFIVLKGYNIVGDGTPQALLPILTGKKETELPEARRGFFNASYVDVFPWLWKEFKKAGYVTQWAEDMQSIGTFQLRMLGFRKQPVDHYMRVFYLEAERYYNRFRRLCLGSISRHKNMINWVKEFFQMYESKPKFSFIFHSEASHNYNK